MKKRVILSFMLILLLISLPLGSALASISHEVKKGDTLWSISQSYNLTVDELRKINNISPRNNIILPGDFITIPRIPVPNPTKPGDTQLFYTVKKGDTLWSIALKFNMSVVDLMRINNLDNTIIHPGQKLLVQKLMDKGNRYIVKPGNTLWGISMELKTTVRHLKGKNGLKGDLIFPGQVLVY